MGYFKVLKKDGNYLEFEIGYPREGEVTPKILYNILLDSLQLILFPDKITAVTYSPEITPEIQEKAKGSPQEKTFEEYIFDPETNEKYEFVAGQIPSATGDDKYLSQYVPKAIKKVEMIAGEMQDGSETYGYGNDPVFWKGRFLAEFTDKSWFDFLPPNWQKEIFHID